MSSSAGRSTAARDNAMTNTGLIVLAAAALVCGVVWFGAVLAVVAAGDGWHPGTASVAVHFLVELLRNGDPSLAWARAATVSSLRLAPVFWSILTAELLAAGVLAWVGATRVSLRRGRERHRSDARWATAKDEKAMRVSADPTKRPHRLVVGRSTVSGSYLAADDCVSGVLFGPNGSGKTVGLIIPNVLEWQGSVVMTTAKPQDLVPVMAERSRRGRVWVVAPGGAPGMETACWSPVAYAVDAESADRMAEWMVESSGMTGDPKARPWNAQARKYLKGLLLASNLGGRGIDGFVEWSYEGELAREYVEDVLRSHGQAVTLREYSSTWQIHEEGKGSVLFTAFGLADTYNRPSIRLAASRSDFSPAELFGDQPASVFLVTPQSEADRCTPYFTALISSIVHEAEARAAAVGGPIDPRLLLALDEAGNVFRYPRLPNLLTTGRGNGVQLLLAYHDIAQIEHLFNGREVARTILSNAKMRVLLPGVGDLETLRYFSELLGQTRVRLGGEQTGPDGQRSRSQAEQREALAPLHELQQLRDGQAAVLYQNLPPAKVKLRRWFDERSLKRLAHGSKGVAS